jgi:hypothetical protein
MVQSLWKIPDTTNLRTPVTGLKEQASALTEATDGILVGEVRTNSGNSQDSLQYGLDITVPSLNNYRYRVATLIQPLTMYPLSVIVGSRNSMANNEDELIKVLADILGSDRVQRIIGSLITQARSSTAG